MCGAQCGRLGEEWYFLVVPVEEDMTRHRENLGGATLQERNGFFEFWRKEGERWTLRRRPVLNVSILVRNSRVEENVGRL